MSHSTKKTKTEALQDIVREYIEDGQPWPAERRAIAAWAVHTKRWLPQRKTQIDICAEELAEAMRLEMETDPQGRTVRAKYCAKIAQMDADGKKVQSTLWFGRDAAPDLMHLSLQQRREGIVGDCKQLKTDLDSYNENNLFSATLQLSFNFEQDLEDLAQDTEYNPKPHDDDE